MLTKALVKTRTKNALVLGAVLAALSAGLVWVAQKRGALSLNQAGSALDAVPAGALLVASGDLDRLRNTPVGQMLMGEGREIPGLGKVRDVCGMDPLDGMRELVLAVPAAGEEGDFGIAASGDVADEALINCAVKVIEARGGRPVVTPIGGFRCVRDASMAATGGEIAVRKGGPVLLGAGPYLRAMIDAVEGRGPTVRSSVAHTRLKEGLGSSDVRVTVVLTPEQRRTLDEELEADMGEAPAPDGPSHSARKRGLGSALVAGALGLTVSSQVQVRGLLLCETQDACAEWAQMLRKAKEKRANDFATKLLGFGEVLSRIEIEAQGESVLARVALSADEAKPLLERLLTLRSTRHPMPPATADQPLLPAGPPDDVIPAPSVSVSAQVPKASPSAGPPPKR